MNKLKSNIINIWRTIHQQPLVRHTVTTTIWSTLGKGTGFIIPLFIAALFGANLKTDIFFLAYGIVFYLTDIFSPSLESNIVPFVADMKQKGKNEISLFINKLFSIVFLSMFFLALILLIIAKPLLRLITHFPASSSNLLFKFFAGISPLLILVVCSGIAAGVLNAYFKFWLPAISPGIRAFVCLTVIFALKRKLGIQAAILGYVLGEAVRLLILGYFLAKERIVSLRFNVHFDDKLFAFFKTVSFQMISMVAIGLNPLVDKAMASWLETGSVSILQYADRLYFIPVTFISSGLVVVILSHWSNKYYQHKRIEILKKDMHKAIEIVGIIAIALAILLAVFSRQIVNIAYARGEFPLKLLSVVRSTFLFYLAGIAFYLISQIVARAHLVLKNTKILMIAAFIANIFNVIFNLILMRFIGVKGIALSTTIAYGATLGYLYWSFNRVSDGGGLNNGF